MKVSAFLCTAVLALAAQPALAQAPAAKPSKTPPKPVTKPRAAQPPAAAKESPQRKFVVNVVESALALRQGDPQDRLRVLNSALMVLAPFDNKRARAIAQEGARIEADLIAAGQTPAVSMMSSGKVDCDTAADFVLRLPDTALSSAEQSLIGAITMCGEKVAPVARQRLEVALERRIVAPRATMAVIDGMGADQPGAQQLFDRLFRSLPSERDPREAPNFAAMYAQMAKRVPRDLAERAGLNFLEWLNEVDAGNERQMAVNISTQAMQQALGEDGYREALAKNVMARQMAETAGQPAEIVHQEYETVSVAQAMRQRTDAGELRDLPASLRAREAAASGFARGTGGDRDSAERFFDVAFSALNEVWSNRTPGQNAAAVVEEVSEAAAHVDPVAALQRAQALDDASAQAIGMIAVARVVAGQQR